MQLQAFMFMGRPGSGKGTQSNLLIESLKKIDPDHSVLHLETGAEFRKLFKPDGNFTSRLGKKTIDAGILMPVFMTVYAWGNVLVEKFDGTQHLIFDGTPRKLIEAKLIEEVFPFYGLIANVIYLDAHVEETTKRLLLRAEQQGRKDDTHAGIAKRHSEYEKQVQPTLDYLRKHEGVRFHDIDGIGTIPEVHARILEALKLG
jgi:adenylate kinase